MLSLMVEPQECYAWMLDVCIEGLKSTHYEGPFIEHTHNEGVFFLIHIPILIGDCSITWYYQGFHSSSLNSGLIKYISQGI